MNGAEVQFEGWHKWIQVAAFTIIFLTFCYLTIRTLLMRRDHEQKMAAMPLEDEDHASEKANSPKSRS